MFPNPIILNQNNIYWPMVLIIGSFALVARGQLFRSKLCYYYPWNVCSIQVIDGKLNYHGFFRKIILWNAINLELYNFPNSV